MDSWGQMNLSLDILPLLLPSEFNSSLLRMVTRILIEQGMGFILMKSGLHKNKWIISIHLDGIAFGTVWVDSSDSQINPVEIQWNLGE